MLLYEHVYARAICNGHLPAKGASCRIKLGNYELVATVMGLGNTKPC